MRATTRYKEDGMLNVLIAMARSVIFGAVLALMLLMFDALSMQNVLLCVAATMIDRFTQWGLPND